MKIYIVRHGETKANKSGLLQGWTDTELSELGIELAEITGEGLKDVHFDIAFSSPLKRAFNTAEIILKHNNFKDTKIIKDNRLKEINMGDYEGKCVLDKNNGIPKDYMDLFFVDPLRLKPFPNGEDARTVCNRMQNFLFELAKENKYENVLITTHGFALRALLNFMYENKQDFWQGRVPLNCAVNIIEYDGEFKFIEKDKIYYDDSKVVDRYKF